MALSLAPSLDDLCRQAVELGCRELGFERIGILLVDPAEPRKLFGTFGTDDHGHLRDEHDIVVRLDDEREVFWLPVYAGATPMLYRQVDKLYDKDGKHLGYGEHAAAGLWDGNHVSGIVFVDNLLTGAPIDETQRQSEQREYVETIRNSGDNLLTVINEILDFSKIESGKMELEVQDFNLATCVEDALDLFVARAAEKGIELAYYMGEDVPLAIAGDMSRLRQILVNLLGNAVKFTERGEIVVEIRRDHATTAPAAHYVDVHQRSFPA